MQPALIDSTWTLELQQLFFAYSEDGLCCLPLVVVRDVIM